LLSMVNWVSCLREYCPPHSVFLGEKLQLFPNRPIELNGVFTAALVREPLMLEARGCSPFFSIVNSVRCFKEYCPPLSFHGEEHHLCALKPLSSEGSIHYTSSKKYMNVRSWRDKHFVFRWELSYLYKRILPITQCFHGWVMSTLLHRTQESAWKKHSTSRKQMSRFEAGASSALFPCENWVSMWKECLRDKSFLNWRFLHSEKYLLQRKWTNPCISATIPCVRGGLSCTFSPCKK
jgi:hypothetical protein